ncbi:hypothetical protein Verru16b_02025 [Lacunisphaera limnophila]|uniref:Glycosyltransferase RgtA/B/C/D-like domain-containing protein n=1 Tax=Lacunisphaera limnophila TaxID=1838286 RepID=A0A1D8AVR3_9BACT|nr:glycosyltransferase family 39 protein [Lacunisphaera limnophila]AOS44956.1 hypothetical protein Verru16b_02025 [Lacunisphaera limnophila]
MSPARRIGFVAALTLLALTLWLRWPSLGFSLWNVDEAIHAAAARTLLDGGVLYRDAVDQRTPLSYYAVAAVFAVAGENNLWAVRLFIAALVAATGGMLFLAARAIRDPTAGVAAGLLYVLLATSVLFQGDANAANTEWFVAFFSSAAAAVFLTGGALPSLGRLLATGLLAGCAFLSKQPALLDLSAPLAAVLYLGWRQARSARAVLADLAAIATGWGLPIGLALAYFAAHGALRDAVFYTWSYNLAYYGPEITTATRVASAVVPLQLVGTQPLLLVLWLAGSLVIVHRLLQRQPAPAESASNPALVYLAVWTLAGLGGAASGGRSFDHYTIQFLAPFCLGAGLVLAHLAAVARAAARTRSLRVVAALILAGVAGHALVAAWSARERTLPEDPSIRVSAYIREQSAPADRIFVWGYHPDIYLHADRRPASRFLYASFLSGLVPWTNIAPGRNTAYAVVPGTMDTLLAELTARPPRYIVDCSAGPNRHWQKYPLDDFPALQGFIRARYRLEKPEQFIPQGFRLYVLLAPGEAAATPAAPPLAAELAATLPLGTLGAPLAPVVATAPFGAGASLVEGRLEYFAHAPSSLVYRVPAAAAALRGSFGIRPGAYAAENSGPSDGAEFIVRWRPAGGAEQVLLRRLLRPRDEPADRGLHTFRVTLPPHGGGELELVTGMGPADNSASDWTFWSDLLLENYR